MARIVIPGFPHHIIQRGNRNLDVFFNDEDRTAYLCFLRDACEKNGVIIWSYCLMTNHVHFIAVPEKENSLALCFSEAHGKYTRRINSRKDWKGHLWQARFGSSVLDEKHLIAAIRYIERNPVRAGMVKEAWEYRWSSAPWHMGLTTKDSLVKEDSLIWELVGDWYGYLKEEDSDDFLKNIRLNSPVSRPVGNMEFLENLEKRFERPFVRKSPGRHRIKK